MKHRSKILGLFQSDLIKQWAPFSILTLCTISTLLLLSSSCTSVSRSVVTPPQVEGAHFVGNQQCEDCHAEITRQFPGSVHSRFFKEEPEHHGVSGCESCHGAGSKHIQAGGGKNVFIHNPGKDPQPCLECHQEKHAEFSLPQHHPVLEGQMNCVDCHDPHGRDIFKQPGGLGLARQDQQCAQCHREQTRSFVFVHEGMQDGCTTCHQPHGSINDKMLIQRDSNLCLRCHSQMQFDPNQVLVGKMDHSTFLSAGTCWTSGCHTAVHGSMVNPRLLY
jgi:predicted CXXCH cytochrome family protein